MKKILGVIAVAAVLLTAGVAVACDGPWMGHGPGYMGQYRGDNPAGMKKFQQETLSLRDDMAGKQIDLGVEYDKAAPDAGRIAALRKDVADIEAKLQAAADRHGVRGWSRNSGNWMADGRGGCGCW